MRIKCRLNCNREKPLEVTDYAKYFDFCLTRAIGRTASKTLPSLDGEII